MSKIRNVWDFQKLWGLTPEVSYKKWVYVHKQEIYREKIYLINRVMQMTCLRKTSDQSHVDSLNQNHWENETLRKKQFTVTTIELLNHFNFTSPTFNQSSAWFGNFWNHENYYVKLFT